MINKDVLKTVGGLLLIGVVVVATFLYGNQQRQEQMRQEQGVEQQATSIDKDTNTKPKTQTQPKADSDSSPSASPNPSLQPLPTRTPETGASSIIPMALTGLAAWRYFRGRKELAFAQKQS